MSRLWRQARRQPFALAFAAVVLVIAVVSGATRGAHLQLRTQFGTGYEPVMSAGHWWSPLTSVFLADTTAELLLVLAGGVVLLGFAERLMGTWRTALVFVLGAFGGTGLGILAQSAGVASGELWSVGVSELWTVDPFTPIVACLMAGASFAGVLWRRRIRVVTLSTVLMLLLYSGQPADLYRLIAAIIGLVLGAALRPHRMHRLDLSWRRSSHHETRTLLASVVGVLSIGPLVTVFSGGRFGILAPLGMLLTQEVPAPGDVVDRCLLGNITRQCVNELTLERVSGAGPVLVSLLPLLALLVASVGIARGRRFAAWLAIVVNAGLAALGAWYYGLLPVSGQPYSWRWHSAHYWEVALILVVSVLVPLATAVLLIANLRRFPVRTRPALRRRFVLATSGSFLALAALYVGAGWLLRDQFRPHVTLLDLVTDVPERFIPVGFLRLERLSFLPAGPLSTTLYQWVGPVFWIILLVGAVLCMRSSPAGTTRDDGARLRSLLAAGGGSLAFMSTWEGNSLWFNRAGTAAIAYRVVNGVAITTGEPIGPIGSTSPDAASAVADFATMCDDHGWVPVFYSIHDGWRALFGTMGWQSMPVGEETVLRPSDWNPTGKRWQDIRSSVNRAERAGVRAVWTSYRDLPVLQALQIAEISEQWVQEKELPELGFTLGGLDELRDPAVRLMIALDADARVHAVTSWLPTRRGDEVIGWTLDFMRRRPESMNGVMEFLIAETLEMLREQPVEFLSLSAAPLARAAEAEPAAPSLPMLVTGFLRRTLEPVYGFSSLLAFKRKFQPEFHPLHMAYPDPLALPAIGLALVRAYLPSLTMREAVAFVRGLG
ncbi:phosphatidylglycerol lysyltransferase domain-containing protein [Glaciibacter sp. 2TAF33]|uniref:phosphatidylglycerol lysyltransferase domain-containing protein n=1 Tax=Glaciibacter sp. 2TAF33 TaxID=3233015 RepID=UPI003F918B4D